MLGNIRVSTGDIDCRMHVGRTGPAGNKNRYVEVSVQCLSMTDFTIPEESYRDRETGRSLVQVQVARVGRLCSNGLVVKALVGLDMFLYLGTQRCTCVLERRYVSKPCTQLPGR